MEFVCYELGDICDSVGTLHMGLDPWLVDAWSRLAEATSFSGTLLAEGWTKNRLCAWWRWRGLAFPLVSKTVFGPFLHCLFGKQIRGAVGKSSKLLRLRTGFKWGSSIDQQVLEWGYSQTQHYQKLPDKKERGFMSTQRCYWKEPSSGWQHN